MTEWGGADAFGASFKIEPTDSTSRGRAVNQRLIGLGILDLTAWFGALGAATVLLGHAGRGGLSAQTIAGMAAILAAVQGVVALALRLPLGRWRVGSFDEALSVGKSWALSTASGTLFAFFHSADLAQLVALAAPMAVLGMLTPRLLWRHRCDTLTRVDAAVHGRPLLVFGAGSGGEQILRSLIRDPASPYRVVGLMDDSPRKSRRRIEGIEVLGTRHDLSEIAAATGAEVLLIAIPSAESETVGQIERLARACGLEVRVLPPAAEIIGGLDVSDIREVTEADLLGREEVSIDLDAIRSYVTGKRVLVTGAGGSIGSELARQLHELEPARLMMLDRDESALHGVQLSIEGKALLDTPDLIVADIRDEERIDAIFERERPQVVFHAAALKHLTLLENHPTEGVKTNVWGSANLLDSALRHGVERFVNVSTDKAANPTSVLGATKLLAERLTARAAEQSGRPFVSVRFGNVLGSRGSVLPTFRSQIENGGPVTVTHEEVTRYFMTIPEAVRLVLQSGAIGRPGEIMILDMGEPVRIADMARRLIERMNPSVEIVYTGLRPGEKLHEILVATEEIGVAREHPRVIHTAGSTELCSFEHLRPSGARALGACCRQLQTLIAA